MFATRAIAHRGVAYRIVASAALQMKRGVAYQVFSSVSSNVLPHSRPADKGIHYTHHRNSSTISSSNISSNMIRGTVSDGVPTSDEIQQNAPGHVTRTLRVLKMDVVRTILDELRSVDVNSDGR
jgi:hypothetical protein